MLSEKIEGNISSKDSLRLAILSLTSLISLIFTDSEVLPLHIRFSCSLLVVFSASTLFRRLNEEVKGTLKDYDMLVVLTAINRGNKFTLAKLEFILP